MTTDEEMNCARCGKPAREHAGHGRHSTIKDHTYSTEPYKPVLSEAEIRAEERRKVQSEMAVSCEYEKKEARASALKEAKPTQSEEFLKRLSECFEESKELAKRERGRDEQLFALGVDRQVIIKDIYDLYRITHTETKPTKTEGKS